MLPRTINKRDPMACISAMQKCIRRAMEVEAFRFAAEVAVTSKPFLSMVCNRLQIISHEDIGLANPEAIILTKTCCDQAIQLYNKDKPGRSLMPIGTAIRFMCRGKKSREGDEFLLGVAFPVVKEGEKEEFPDWVFDMHTHKGRKLGRGIEHFLTESTKLIPEAAEETNRYHQDARAFLERKDQKSAENKTSLFD